MYKYFSNSDFEKCDPPCQIDDMNEGFMLMLDMARDVSGIPYVLTSAYRDKEHELKKGRPGTSSHIHRVAVDIKATTSRERYLIMKGLLTAGFKRIGIGKNFIHVDRDQNKDEHLIWHYYK